MMDKRLLNIAEASEYIGLGKTKARIVLEQIGAVKRFGRAVRYDISIIDKRLNNETEFETISR